MNYFCCYHDYREKLAKLSDQEVGRLFRALLNYSATGERQQLAGREDIAFDFIAADIDKAKEDDQSRSIQNTKNGKKGGRPKKPSVFSDENPAPENPPVFLETKKSDGFLEKKEEKEEKKKNQKEKKEKEESKREKVDAQAVTRPSRQFSPEEEAYQAAVYLGKRMMARFEGQKPPEEKRLQAWAKEFDRCHRLDGRSWEEIGQVLRFSQRDPFWSQNILSGKKFREKYLQLLAKMQAGARSALETREQAFPDYGDEEEYLW